MVPRSIAADDPIKPKAVLAIRGRSRTFDPREPSLKARVDLIAPVTAFKDRYNCHWRLEKLEFMSPLEACQAYDMRKAA